MKTRIIYTLISAIITIIGLAYSYNLFNMSNNMFEIFKEIIFKLMAFGGASLLVILNSYWIINDMIKKKKKKDLLIKAESDLQDLIRKFEIYKSKNDGLFDVNNNALIDTELKENFTIEQLKTLRKLKYIKIKNIDFEVL